MKGKFSTDPRVEEAYRPRWPASPDTNNGLLRNGISYHGYMIYYHQFMRRNFAGSINWKFFRTAPFGNGRNEVAFRIDTYRLIRLSQFRERMEEDYWYGPKFNLARIDDPNDYGFTKHLGKTAAIFDRSIRSEFYRYVRNDEKIFEIEEVVLPQDEEYKHQGFIINRYVHSIRDMKNHHFCSFGWRREKSTGKRAMISDLQPTCPPLPEVITTLNCSK